MPRVAVLSWVAMAWLAISAAATEPGTLGWPHRFSESYSIGRGETLQLPLEWDDLKARRFLMRLDAPRAFDVLVTRDRDGAILFSGRRSQHHQAVIPWGRGETAHLALAAPRDLAVLVTVQLATDPAESGLAIYTYHVNRFLQLYAEGDSTRAVHALEAAIAEDPADSVAALLWRSAWHGAGMTAAPMRVDSDEQARLLWLTVAEGQRVQRLRRAVPQALAAAGPDSARALLAAAEPFESERGRAAAALLLGTVAIAADDWGTAIGALHESLRHAADPQQRFDAYRLLVEAYRGFGDEQQAAQVIEQAVAAAPDAASRAEAEQWRKAPSP